MDFKQECTIKWSYKETQICRLCGESANSNDSFPIFGDQYFIAEKISRCLPLVVLSSDKLPPSICKQCLFKLNVSYQLTINSLKVDKQLRQELVRVESAIKCFYCDYCNKNFTESKAFYLHMRSEHFLWKCDFCVDQIFGTSEELLNHKKTHHQGQVITCMKCPRLSAQPVSSTRKAPAKRKAPPPTSAADILAKRIQTSLAGTQVLTKQVQTPSVSTNALAKQIQIPSLLSSINPLAVQVQVPSTSNQTVTNVQENVEGAFEENPTVPDAIESDTEIATDPPDAVDSDSDVDEIDSKIDLKSKCKICGINIPKKKYTKTHMEIHADKECQCGDCREKFPTIYALFQHKQQTHNKFKKFQLRFACMRCEQFFSSDCILEAHKVTGCKPRKLATVMCKYCNEVFTTEIKLNFHMRKHKEEILNDPNGVVYKCVSCPKIFADKEFFQKHRNVHDPQFMNKYKCGLCDRSFRDNNRLRSHVRSIHEGIKPHSCDVCNRSFFRRSNMLVHRKTHFDNACSVCDQEFESYNDLADHSRTIHNLIDPNKIKKKRKEDHTFVCNYCGKILSTYKSLLGHESVHTGEKPYQCKKCDKRFRSYATKWAHEQRHERGAFICELCGKIFPHKANLKTHMNTHLPVEQRKYQCPVCNKRFVRKCHMIVHKRIHDGIRPYSCDICGLSFVQQGDMKRHKMRHLTSAKLKSKRQPSEAEPNVEMEQLDHIDGHSFTINLL